MAMGAGFSTDLFLPPSPGGAGGVRVRWITDGRDDVIAASHPLLGNVVCRPHPTLGVVLTTTLGHVPMLVVSVSTGLVLTYTTDGCDTKLITGPLGRGNILGVPISPDFCCIIATKGGAVTAPWMTSFWVTALLGSVTGCIIRDMGDESRTGGCSLTRD